MIPGCWRLRQGKYSCPACRQCYRRAVRNEVVRPMITAPPVVDHLALANGDIVGRSGHECTCDKRCRRRTGATAVYHRRRVRFPVLWIPGDPHSLGGSDSSSFRAALWSRMIQRCCPDRRKISCREWTGRSAMGDDEVDQQDPALRQVIIDRERTPPWVCTGPLASHSVPHCASFRVLPARAGTSAAGRRARRPCVY
jgi:hypothetical protein